MEKGFCYKVSDQSQDIKKLQAKDEEYEKTVKVLRNGLIGIAAFLAVVFLIWSYVKFCHHSSVLDDPIVEKEISVGSFTTNTPHNKANSVTMIEDGESGQKVNLNNLCSVDQDQDVMENHDEMKETNENTYEEI